MSIALSLGNNLTTGGIFKPTAVNNTSVNNVTDFAGIAGGGTLILLSTQTASASASISFTTGIDSTYDEYIFKFINIHPATDASVFEFNLSTDGGSTYDVTKTTTWFYAQHYENDASTEFGYDTGQDLAQSTSYQRLGLSIGSDNDQSGSGYLHLFNPSSATYVKHFMARFGTVRSDDLQTEAYCAGYGNTVSACNAVDFKFHNASNIDDGIIKMYGLVKS
jgi:hypothetical protein